MNNQASANHFQQKDVICPEEQAQKMKMRTLVKIGGITIKLDQQAHLRKTTTTTLNYHFYI